MKKIIKNNILIIALFSTIFSYANDFTYSNNDKGGVTQVTFKNVNEGNILSIKDINGFVLYKETIKSYGKYSKNFDLSALPDGDYLFEMEKEFEIKIIPFKVNLKKVDFNKELESVIFKPVVIVENGFVKVQQSLLNKEPLAVNIYYENGQLVHSNKFENTEILSKSYDFSSSVKGNYRIEFSNGNRTFVKEIKI
ncbi:hypothetical protein EGM88_04240 [Aureibaculum marinum]|uniref:T9SS C-terminal target domain-containing protein n=1 Tax=Aureibaculum marinum TaxID=2487930 RepID=A0A3N4NWG1_9FLAO|nr:hypothetical protein [Aureibaculum marinum]RPD99067.1 hypothetical protein EGM88_04240 [Aureibaculum marinum]